MDVGAVVNEARLLTLVDGPNSSPEGVVAVGAAAAIRIADPHQLVIGVPGVSRTGAPPNRRLAFEVALTIEDVGESAVGLKPVGHVIARRGDTRATVTGCVERVAFLGQARATRVRGRL